MRLRTFGQACVLVVLWPAVKILEGWTWWVDQQNKSNERRRKELR